MTMSTITSREFNQDLGRAKKASFDGPVVITDRGRPSHVLMSYSDYQKLVSGGQPNIVEALSLPGLSDVALDPPCLSFGLRPADLA